jgi:hypothetical protein
MNQTIFIGDTLPGSDLRNKPSYAGPALSALGLDRECESELGDQFATCESVEEALLMPVPFTLPMSRPIRARVKTVNLRE